jgi:hypothetical protein
MGNTKISIYQKNNHVEYSHNSVVKKKQVRKVQMKGGREGVRKGGRPRCPLDLST